MPDLIILELVQIFLLLMLVVGAAAWAVGKGLDKDPDVSVGGVILFYAITVITWIVLTAVTVASVGALAFGIIWVWTYFAQR